VGGVQRRGHPRDSHEDASYGRAGNEAAN